MRGSIQLCGLWLVGLALAGGFLGCGMKNPYEIDASQVREIWMDTLPGGPDSARFSDDPEVIEALVAHITGLKLRPRTERDEPITGINVFADLVFADGTRREFGPGGMYFSEAGGPAYVVLSKGGCKLLPFYEKLGEPKPPIRGTVVEIDENNDDRLTLLIEVDASTRQLVGDRTYATVDKWRIANAYQKWYQDISVGDTVDFYVNTGVRESYPTQCDAWKVIIIRSAAQQGESARTSESPSDAKLAADAMKWRSGDGP